MGIGPYRVSANSYCPAGFKRKTFLTQLFKRNYLQICCTVTGGVYYATLLVKDGQVVGADVASSAKTGVMHGLKMPE